MLYMQIPAGATHVSVAMEYVPGGELLDRIEDASPAPVPEVGSRAHHTHA